MSAHMYEFEVLFDCPKCGWHGTYGLMSGMKCGNIGCRHILVDDDREDMQLNRPDKIKERIKEILLA